MKEVKKCSISGVAFTLDTDAYEALEAYLESLKKAYKESADGAEIVADIEARIAELILSAQDNARVVEKPLVMNIIRQLGTAEDIVENADADLQHDTPRIPRRLYRDMENAKLGGVCAGIGKYFDVDPVWVRLVLFLPFLLSWFGWIPFLHWTGPMMGNLFGIFLICYFIMWFAVPPARTARQKLEMNGERITAQSVAQATADASADADSRAKPIVAEAVSVFGKVVLILLKIFAGLIVFGLIMSASALIIGLFALIVGGPEFMHIGTLTGLSLWVPILGIFVVLIPVILLIYVMMCLIASRKPGGKTVLVIFLVWLASVIACASVAIHENVPGIFREKHRSVSRMIEDEVQVEGDLETLEELLDQIESGKTDQIESLRMSVPSKNVKISVERRTESGSDGKQTTVRAVIGKTTSDQSTDDTQKQ
ncbi:PspC domain-containing protein [Alistipes sp.]|uniref:PspC domain-containing protein n=1 Tax=Alistipes sp. TaxID=1872444 RepID=UPI003AF0A312